MENDWLGAAITTYGDGAFDIACDKLHTKPRDWGTFKGEILKGPEYGNFWRWCGVYNGVSYTLCTQGFAGWSMLDLSSNGRVIKSFWTVEEAEDYIKGLATND